jgi:hypothetical protein
MSKEGDNEDLERDQAHQREADNRIAQELEGETRQ